MNDLGDTQLTMRINDKLPSLKKVQEAQKHLATILAEIDKATSGKGTACIDWLVTDASSGSYLVTVQGYPNTEEIGLEDVASNLEVIDRGLKQLQLGAERPHHFSDAVLRSLRSLSELSGKNTSVDLIGRHGIFRISSALASNIDKIINAVYKSYGSVEGVLNVIDMRKQTKPVFKITDALGSETLDCIFSRQDLQKAKDALTKRVQGVTNGSKAFSGKAHSAQTSKIKSPLVWICSHHSGDKLPNGILASRPISSIETDPKATMSAL